MLLKIVVPEGTLLVRVDMESLFTSIPNNWGILAVAHFLELYYPEMTQNKFTLELLKFMLNNIYFQLMGMNYQQICGTSMGPLWAPAHACLHLGLWEREDVYQLPMYLGHVLQWLRYIDDILIL